MLAAVRGGFCELNHGKKAPLERLLPGDRLLYYSPREKMRDGDAVQAFTATGEVLEGHSYEVHVSDTFRAFRKQMRYFDAQPAAIRPLLARLSFSRGAAAWGQVLRRGVFRIDPADYELIANAMNVADNQL